MTQIPLAIPNIGIAEEKAVMDAVRSGFVSSVGPQVSAFESAFADYIGSRFAVACASGTAALHVAMRVLGVERGTDVLCADFTFAGSANPIVYQGATPVFVDSDARTWDIDPILVCAELDRRFRSGIPMPAAIEVVHVLGQPADLAPIVDAAAEYGVPLIEDAAESLGAQWTSGPLAGKHTGTVGKIGCFSFNGNKIATTGGGGMVVTDDEDLAARVRHLTTQAKLPDSGYLHDEVGYNYRLTNLAAALGVVQLGRIEEFVAAKKRIARCYDEAFDGLPIVLPPRVEGFDSTYWLYSILTEDVGSKERLLEHLGNCGIGARPLWRPLSDQPSFEGARTIGSASVARSIFDRGVSLPCSTQLSVEEQNRVIEAVAELY